MEANLAGIVGIGSYVPQKILTNEDLERMVETSDEWIQTRTGIRERRVVAKGEATSDLAAKAGLKALDDAGLKPEDVDLIIVATSSPDMIFPSTACLVQTKMGIKNCPAFDVAAACSGFVFALSVASQYVNSGTYSTVLVIGADALTRYVDWSDRDTCVLFGDGAGAVVLQKVKPGFGILSSYLASDGAGADLLKIPIGGSARPADQESLKQGLQYIQMSGKDIFKFAVQALPEATTQALQQTGLSVADIDYLISHQANRRIIKAAAEKMKLSSDKVICNIHKYGNTSTASIPLALDDLYESGQLRRGNLLVLVGFGAGLTWGANVIRWQKE